MKNVVRASRDRGFTLKLDGADGSGWEAKEGCEGSSRHPQPLCL